MAIDLKNALADLEIDATDCMDDPKAFIDRVFAKSKEFLSVLDAGNTLAEHEKKFKEKAVKNPDAKKKAEEVFEQISTMILDLEPDVLVNLMAMFPEVLQVANNSIRAMSMRSGAATTLSKRQISLLYTKLKNTYEVYIQFMKMFDPEKLPKFTPIMVARKGNFSDYSSTAGVKTYEFIVDGYTYINPFAVANILKIKDVTHYMDLPDKILELMGEDEEVEINGHSVKLRDISQKKDEE